MMTATTAPTSKTLDGKLNRLLKKDPTRSPLDLATEILDSYSPPPALKRDFTWVLALYVSDQQRLFTLEPKKPTKKEQALIDEHLAIERRNGRLPYGHPDRMVILPNQTVRQWHTLTAAEHRYCAKDLREQGAQCYQRAQMHEDAAMRLEGALAAL